MLPELYRRLSLVVKALNSAHHNQTFSLLCPFFVRHKISGQKCDIVKPKYDRTSVRVRLDAAVYLHACMFLRTHLITKTELGCLQV